MASGFVSQEDHSGCLEESGDNRASVETGRPVRGQEVMAGGEPWPLQEYILKVEPIETSKGQDVEGEEKENQGLTQICCLSPWVVPLLKWGDWRGARFEGKLRVCFWTHLV